MMEVELFFLEMINCIWRWIKIWNFIIGEVEDKNWNFCNLEKNLWLIFLMERFIVEIAWSEYVSFVLRLSFYPVYSLCVYLYNRFKMNCRLDGGKV